MGISTLRACHFEASEDIMTKFKSHPLHTTRIKDNNENARTRMKMQGQE
jgi:hypothetical protein